MKNIILTIIFGMFLISCVNAYNITAGESINITLSESYNYYSIIGNHSYIDLNITQEGNIVIISLDKYSKSDEFEIIFFNKEKEVITEHHYSSGGSSTRTTYVENKTIEYVDVPVYINNESFIEKEKPFLEKGVPESYSKKGFYIILVLNLIAIIGIIIYLKAHLKKNISEEISVTPLE